MPFPRSSLSSPSRIALRSFIWIALGATVFSQIDARALRTDLSAQATQLVTELRTGDDYAADVEFVTQVTAARSKLFWGKGVGHIDVYSRVPRGEGDYEYYQLSNFYEQDSAEWVNLGTFGYEDVDARSGAQAAFKSQRTS